MPIRTKLIGAFALFWLWASGAGGPSRSTRDVRLPLLASCDFESGRADGWEPKDPSVWRVVRKDGSMVYELTAPGGQGRVRAPSAWSLWSGHDLDSLEFTGRVRCYTDPAVVNRDMCVFFHFRDAEHFGYVHFAAASDELHNIIGLVDGADRVKINSEAAGSSAPRLTDKAWHTFKVTCDGRTGEVRAYMDDMATPILTARDLTTGHGVVGVGSFDDTGCFDDLELRGLRRQASGPRRLPR